ncbi:putative fad dependent oxidoreductase superfamily [Phaeomoniella chlamydospora]|uniref:Putative fad dependent oxidoreductase superfamily n=1 Tax=Phaeomoniella chlamydospora TaxID=158046 RepID=A0A0G2EQ46_PHACM|nr:putative fad dependent oxidoreductase superfamily [Phaeomoniella chlamydospora]
MLEARGVCSGATGRNGGHLKPDLYRGIASLAKQYGSEAAEEVAAFEAAHVPAIKEVIEKEDIEADLLVTRAIDVQFSGSYARQLKIGYDVLVSDGVDTAKTVQYIPKEKASQVTGVKGAEAAFTYTAGSIWPYRFITHLLSKAISMGLNLQTHTLVTSISEAQDANKTWTINSERGSIKAKTVIFASNAYTSALLAEYKNKIVPVRGFCSRIVTPGPNPPPHLSCTYTLRFNDWEYDYLIPRPDGSIIVGGARKNYLQTLSNWYDNVNDSTVPPSVNQYFDGYMQRHFHGWETSGAYTDRVWSGIMGYSTDYLPHIGAVPHKPNQFILAGFTGHGMPEIFLSAKGIAQMVRDGKSFKETGVPRIYQTTDERLNSGVNRILADTEHVWGKGAQMVSEREEQSSVATAIPPRL